MGVGEDVRHHDGFAACRSSKVFCAVERNDSGIPASFAAFYRYQRGSG